VRLAARLTGWKIDIKDTAKYDAVAEDQKIAEQLQDQEAYYSEDEEDLETE
jgi:N utilization substance protein A